MKLKASGVRMISITPQIYTHDGTRPITKMCRGVSVCEDCFIKAFCGYDGNLHEREVSRAIQQSVRARYNAIVETSVTETGVGSKDGETKA